MKRIKRLSIFTLFIVLAVLLTACSGDGVIMGSNHTLGENEVVEDDLTVFGGNVTIPETAKVEGDLVVMGGNVAVHGTIEGDVATFGGNVNLKSTAQVDGDIVTVGGNVNREEGATVEGDTETVNSFGETGTANNDTSDDDDDDNGREAAFSGSHRGSAGFGGWFFYLVTDTIQQIVLLFGLGLIAWLVAAFLPEQMYNVGQTVSDSTPLSFGMGVLTAILAGVLFIPMVLLIATICLAIIPFAFYLLLGVGALLGWIVIGQLIGERLLTSLDRPLPSLVMSSIVGVLVLTILTRMPVISVIPLIGGVFWFVGWLVGVLVMLTGLGAVVLTRFGTRPYVPGSLPLGGNGGSYSPPPSTPPSSMMDPTDFDREARADAELKAKIKAALAEADEPKDEPDPEPEDKPSPEADEPKPDKSE